MRSAAVVHDEKKRWPGSQSVNVPISELETHLVPPARTPRLRARTHTQDTHRQRTFDDGSARREEGRTLRVRGEQERDDGEVDDAEVRGAVHPQLGVDDAALLAGEHRRCARGV